MGGACFILFGMNGKRGRLLRFSLFIVVTLPFVTHEASTLPDQGRRGMHSPRFGKIHRDKMELFMRLRVQ